MYTFLHSCSFGYFAAPLILRWQHESDRSYGDRTPIVTVYVESRPQVNAWLALDNYSLISVPCSCIRRTTVCINHYRNDKWSYMKINPSSNGMANLILEARPF